MYVSFAVSLVLSLLGSSIKNPCSAKATALYKYLEPLKAEIEKFEQKRAAAGCGDEQ